MSRLAAARKAGVGVVLVDHRARNPDKPSILHEASCKWLSSVGPFAQLRFAAESALADRWLNLNRGEEGVAWRRCPGCGGFGAAEEVRVGPTYEVGEHIVIDSTRRIAARIVEQAGQTVRCSVLDSPPDVLETLTVSARSIRRVVPGPADCLWRRLAGEFERVDSETAEGASSEPGDLHLRDFAPMSDPLALLASGRAGRVELVEARRKLGELSAALNAPTAGLGGAISAPIELHAHQLAVVRRVLSDPVQRYLLADEVGLGKTIEAGLVIRQRLIDAPRSIVVCLVPSSLVPQWEEELATRLGLRRFRRSGIEVRGYEEANAWKQIAAPDLVVIDEAHRVAAGWTSSLGEQRERYARARTLTARAGRVLLLSATPVLHRERDLLGMLHLLDPGNFSLDDLQGFQRKVADREGLASLFVQIAPDTPRFLLDEPFGELRERYASDRRLCELLDVAEGIDSEEGLASALVEIRAHLSEAYKLHTRMVRNRRVAIDFAVRGRSGATRFSDEDPRSRVVATWLERWRGLLLEAAADADPELRSAYTEVFWMFVQASSGDLEALRHLARYLRSRKRSDLRGAGADTSARDALRGVNYGPGAGDALDELLAALGPEPSVDEEVGARAGLAQACAEAIVDRRAIVFSSAPQTVRALTAELCRRGIRAGSLDADVPTADRASITAAFRQGELGVLVCDAAAEEGLNLQAAEIVVHADVPRIATRLEQRIGRVDRHGGMRTPVPSVVISRKENAYTEALYALMDSGIRVFNESIASSLFAVEAVERGRLGRWFDEGIAGSIADDLADVATDVAREQADINRLDTLESLAREETDETLLVERIEKAEQDHAHEFADAFASVTCSLGPSLGAAAVVADGMVQARIARTSAVSIDRRALPGIDLVSSVSRMNPHPTATGLVRPGDPLIDCISDQADWDDRYQTFAIWGVAEDDFPRLAVRASFIVSADPTEAMEAWVSAEEGADASSFGTAADAPIAIAAMRRRLDAVLPPRPVTLWFDSAGQLIVDDADRQSFEHAIGAVSTTESWSRAAIGQVEQTVGIASLRECFAAIRARGPRAALDAFAARGAVDEALAEARASWTRRLRVLESRAERAGDARASHEAQVEARVTDALLDALNEPRVRWDAAGVVVLTARRS